MLAGTADAGATLNQALTELASGPDRAGAGSWVEIPREPTWLREFAGQRVRVPLPIRSHPRRVALPLVALHQLAVGALLLLPVWFVGELFDPSASGLDVWGYAVVVPLLTFTLPVGAVLSLLGLVGLLDTLRPGPAVVLDSDGIRDARTGTYVAWPDVASLVIVRDHGRGKIASLLFRTRAGLPCRGRRHPFRFGAPLDFWFCRRRKPIVPFWFLTPSRHVLAHAAAELVQRHGGRALDMEQLLPSDPFALRVRPRKPRGPLRAGRS